MIDYRTKMLKALDGFVALHNATKDAWVQEAAFRFARKICDDFGMQPPKRTPLPDPDSMKRARP